METLFSTVAQVSFTLVGLFFLALTLDTKSREFWFGEKLQSRYAYYNLLFLLLPGFISLSGLVPSAWKSISIWPFTSVFLVIIYFIIFRDLRKLKKELHFKKLSVYEERLDSANSARTNIYILLFTSVIGIVANVVYPRAIPFANFLFGLSLFLIVMLSIVPIYGFMSVYTLNKLESKKLESRRASTPKKQNNLVKRKSITIK